MSDAVTERRALGLDVEVLQGFAFSSGGFSEEKGLPLIRIRDLTTGTTETNYCGPYPDEYVINRGDVLIGMDGDFRVVRWSGEKALLNQRVCRVRPSGPSLDDRFLFHALQPEIDRVHRLTPQTTVRHLNTRGIRACTVLDVPLEEQRRIAETLDTIDETIQATERVIAKRKRIRAGLAAGLLSGRPEGVPTEDWKTNETLPPPASTSTSRNSVISDWETLQLGDVAQLKMGQSPAGSLVEDLESRLPFLQGNAEFGARCPAATLQCDEARQRSAPGDALISVRAPVGAINRSDRAYGIGRGLAAVTFKRVDPNFGHHAIVERSRDLHRVSQGTTFSAIGRTELAALRLPVPPLEEQRRIAEILDTIDKTIRVEEAQGDKLRRLRSGLAADLLSGRVRTVAA